MITIGGLQTKLCLQNGSAFLALTTIQSHVFVAEVFFKAFLHVDFFKEGAKNLIQLSENDMSFSCYLKLHEALKRLQDIHDDKLSELGDDTTPDCERLFIHGLCIDRYPDINNFVDLLADCK